MDEQDTFDRLKYRIEVDDEGRRFYYNSDGVLHRDEGPAAEYEDGSLLWFINGSLHREDGPAIEWGNGAKEWYIRGKLIK